ncbi:MAG: hypothetical protein H6718_07100 [Polyangiaceae bacterium]|nr:hypothetical protein [Myxococcales bacterium]MCB9585147.1 hypothetical protein [Polyangiaceae bacterium]
MGWRLGWVWGLGALLLVGCSSDESGGSGAGGSAGQAGSSGAGGTTGATGGSAGSSGAAGAAGTAGSGGTGGAPLCEQASVSLQNDGFSEMGQVFFQQGFAQDECWGVTYEVGAPGCSYAFDKLEVVVGGATDTKIFRVEIWSVDDQGKPDQRLKSLDAQIQGSDSAINQIDISDLSLPLFQDPGFAVAMCFTEHSGLPAIGRDDDGITSGKNWIFDGAWKDAASLGVQGDWIQRVTVTPK